MQKKVLLKLGALLLLAVIILASLAYFNRSPNAKPNGFARKWLTDWIEGQDQKTIPAPLVRICGVSGDRIYTAGQNPQYLMSFDRKLEQKGVLTLNIPLTQKLQAANGLIVDSPEVYLFANNLSTLYKAGIDQPGIDSIKLGKGIFTRSIRLEKDLAVIRGFDDDPMRQVFKTVDLRNGLISHRNPLVDDADGGFATDGLLNYDSTYHRILYLQYYQNVFFCLDTNLNLLYQGHTIDTTRYNPVRIKKLKNDYEQKLVPVTPRFPIIRNSFASNGLLYVISELKADNESPENFRHNSVVDIYRVPDGRYTGSFYIPNIGEDNIQSLFIDSGILIALYKKHIATFRLRMSG
ncbi:MAG: hypothetical protein P4L51_24650 [Puia sp.]|nr:hypothetical protein [Puia sp.]